MAGGPTFPFLQGMQETIDASIASGRESEIQRVLAALQGEMSGAQATINSPQPTLGRGDAGRAAIGGAGGAALGALLGALSGAGAGLGAATGAGQGLAGGLNTMNEMQSERLAQHQKDVANATKIIDDRQKLAARMAMLAQANQGQVFEGMDTRIQGALLMPEVLGQEVNLATQKQKLLSDDVKLEVNAARDLLTYASPKGRLALSQYISQRLNMPMDLVADLSDLKPLESDNLGIRLQQGYLNGITEYMKAKAAGTSVNMLNLIERPKDFTSINQAGIEAGRKMDQWLVEENAQGRYPDPAANLALAGLTKSEQDAWHLTFDGVNNRPTYSQWRQSWNTLNTQMGFMGLMERGMLGLDAGQMQTKLAEEVYQTAFVQNQKLSQNDYTEMYQNRWQALMNDKDHPEYKTMSVQEFSEVVRQDVEKRTGRAGGGAITREPTPVSGKSGPGRKEKSAAPPKPRPARNPRPNRGPNAKTQDKIAASRAKVIELQEANKKKK